MVDQLSGPVSHIPMARGLPALAGRKSFFHTNFTRSSLPRKKSSLIRGIRDCMYVAGGILGASTLQAVCHWESLSLNDCTAWD